MDGNNLFSYIFFISSLRCLDKGKLFFWWLGAEFQILPFSLLVLFYSMILLIKAACVFNTQKKEDCDLMKRIFVAQG